MRSRLAVAALLVCCLSPAGIASAAAAQTGLRLTVSPVIGLRRTHFIVSFTAQLTGFSFPYTSAYRLVVFGGAGRCISARQVPVAPTTPGERVHLTLTPNGGSALWCAGHYTGRLEETFRPVCRFGMPCPLIARAKPEFFVIVRTLKTFAFQVRGSGTRCVRRPGARGRRAHAVRCIVRQRARG